MRNRTFRGTCGLVACLGLMPAAGSIAGPANDEPPPVSNRVELVLLVSGLGPEGGKIEIRPGHNRCKFTPIVQSFEKGQLPARPSQPIGPRDPIVVQSLRADRDCSFEITIHEPGCEPVTYRRSLRLEAPEPGQPTPTLKYKVYLTSPSLASRDKPGPKG